MTVMIRRMLGASVVALVFAASMAAAQSPWRNAVRSKASTGRRLPSRRATAP